MASVVYECPRGVFTRIMEGSHGYELYLDMKKGKRVKITLDAHMTELHTAYMKYNSEPKSLQ